MSVHWTKGTRTLQKGGGEKAPEMDAVGFSLGPSQLGEMTQFP